MQDDIIAQGVELMLYGMGTVLVFLTVLVAATTFMSLLLARFFPVSEPVAEQVQAARVATDARHVAVISAAIARYRSERGS